MTATATRKTVAELLAEHAQDLVPVDGDKAYTFYHGLIWEGVLKQTDGSNVEAMGGSWIIIPADGKKRFDHHEGDWKFFTRMPMANVTVYGPTSSNLESEDPWHEMIKGLGYETPNQIVAYDAKRGMFYLHAHED